MLLAPSDCPRLRFNVLSIDYVRVTNCFYDYDYDYNYIDITVSRFRAVFLKTKDME